MIVATALLTLAVGQEFFYGAAQRAYRGVVEWNTELERQAQEEREQEARELEVLKEEITALRKDPKARVAYLTETFERLLNERNEMAATQNLYDARDRPKWTYLNQRLTALRAELDDKSLEELLSEIATAEKALPRSLKYEADKAKLDALRALLLVREVASYEDKFVHGPVKNHNCEIQPNASAEKYLAEWPRP